MPFKITMSKRALIMGGLLVLVFVFANFTHAQQQEGPDECGLVCKPGVGYNAQDCYDCTITFQGNIGASDIFDILMNIGGFLLVAAGVIAAIVIVISGLVYMSSGSNTSRVQTARAIFKNGVIGALIIFASGLIVSTISLLGTNWRAFFG